jgi:hypothetical protein
MATAGSPAPTYYMVGEADFRPRVGTDTVSFGSGNGGARANHESKSGLQAPIHLPHGATIVSVRVFYQANDPSANLSLSVNAHVVAGGYFTWGSATSEGPSPDIRFVDIFSVLQPGTPGTQVDNTQMDFSLVVSAAGPDGGNTQWGNNLLVHCAVVTYTTGS